VSSNIKTVRYLSGQLTIARFAASGLISRLQHSLPEDCFLLDVPMVGEAADVAIERPRWRGEGSGYSFDDLLAEVLPLTKGSADILVVWDGGELSGIRVRDGVVTQPKVVTVLEAEA
jgi:hypothetical protein